MPPRRFALDLKQRGKHIAKHLHTRIKELFDFDTHKRWKYPVVIFGQHAERQRLK